MSRSKYKVDVHPGQFDVLLLDPPWFYKNRITGENRTKFGEGCKYDCMTDDSILALGPLIQEIAAPSSVMLMWTTPPHLPLALALGAASGFVYCTKAYTWLKINADGTPKGNPGTYTSSCTEDVLLFTRKTAPWLKKFTPQAAGGARMIRQTIIEWNEVGRAQQPLDVLYAANGSVESWPEGTIVIRDPITVHSRKPDDVHVRTDLMYPNARKIELFARRQWPSWVCLGDEVTGNDIFDDLALAASGMYDAPEPEEELIG